MIKSEKYFGVLLALLFIACNNNDFAENPEQSIIGTWQLIETLSDIGDGSGDWKSVMDGYTYTFDSNGGFTSNRFAECNRGAYFINTTDQHLTLDYSCIHFTQGIEQPPGTFVEQFTFETNDLILNPTYVFCVESCGWKFRKTN